VEIPEIRLELNQGTLGGRFTTLEGLLVQIKEELGERLPFALGDSVTLEKKKAFANLIENINKVWMKCVNII
jgi:zinc finger protein